MDKDFYKPQQTDASKSFAGYGRFSFPKTLNFKPTQNPVTLTLQAVMQKMFNGEPLTTHDVTMTHRHADEQFHNFARWYRNYNGMEKRRLELGLPEWTDEKEKATVVENEEANTNVSVSENKHDREKEYEIALILTDFDTEAVVGYDEFKPGGFRYNPSKLYNKLMVLRQQTGDPTLTLDDLKSWSNASDLYWFDTGTQAGRIMYTQNAKAKQEGKKYIPSDDLIDQQNAELKTTDQLKHDVVNGMYVYAQVLEQLQEKITSTTDANRQATLVRMRDRLTSGLQVIITELSANYQKTVEKKPVENKFDLPVLEGNTAKATYSLVSMLVLAGSVSLTVGIMFYALARELADFWKDESEIDWHKIKMPRTLPKPVSPPLAQPSKGPEPSGLPQPPIPFLPDVDLDEGKDDCTPRPIGYHRGGNAHHNQLADDVPPNLIKGTDWEVKGKAFDAWTGGAKQELWEIKTSKNYKDQTEFIKQITINDIIKDALLEYTITKECGKKYILGVDNKELYDDLIENKDLLLLKSNIRLI
jgi:hypothetical protein